MPTQLGPQDSSRALGVSLYQSFWARDAHRVTAAISLSPGALFISPYVEHGGHPTRLTPQGCASRPWEGGTIPHLLTVAPLPRAAPGALLAPSARGPGDTEAISLVAPSATADGPGGTCPGAAVAVAVACALAAAAPERPAPLELAAWLRDGSNLDRARLGAVPEHDAAALDRLAARVEALRAPPGGARRTLDAAGVLDLGASLRLATRR